MPTGRRLLLLSSLLAACEAYHRAAQGIAQEPVVARNKIRLPLRNVENQIFTTTIGVGTPSQNLTAAVDIAWSDLFIPSLTCRDPAGATCDVTHLFNASASSTYASTDEEVKVHHFGFYTSGTKAQDTLELDTAEVTGQSFEEATALRPTYLFNSGWYDAPLGFAREVVQTQESTLQAPSPFMNLVEQGDLSANAFALSLPASSEDEGELVIGESAAGYGCEDKSCIELPLPPSITTPATSFQYASHFAQTYSEQKSFLTGGWAVKPVSATFGTLAIDLTNYTAALSTMDFWLDLPHTFASSLRNQLGVSIYDGSVDCSVLSTDLPNLTFTFHGHGDATHELSVTPAEYIRSDIRLPFVDPEKCIVPIAMHREHNEDEARDLSKFLVLGNVFLRKFRTIFDAERKSVTFLRE